MKDVAVSEWQNRWRGGHPKKPNGDPLPVVSEGYDIAMENIIANDVVSHFSK